MSMFGSAVDGFSECFTVSQKLSQATFCQSGPAWLLLDSTAWQGSVEACSASTQSRALCLLPVLGFPTKCLRTRAVIRCYSEPKNKNKHPHKRTLLFTHSCSSTSVDPLLQCSNLKPMALKSLITQSQALEAFLGVSEWVLETIKQGYSLQFAHRSHPQPLRGRGPNFDSK